jgi:putative sterol carrier protein
VTAKEFFDSLETAIDPARIAGVNHTYLFDIEGEGRWLVELRDGKITVTPNPTGGADAEFRTSAQTFERLASRKGNPMVAYATGKLKFTGDMQAALALQKLF